MDIDWNIIFLSLLSTVIGALSTYFAMIGIEVLKERKKIIDKIFAPLYDELQGISNFFTFLTGICPDGEWTSIKTRHELHKIKPVRLFYEISDFYNNTVYNFPRTYRWTVDFARKKLSDEFGYEKYGYGPFDLYFDWLAEECVYIGNMSNYNNLLENFPKFKEQFQIRENAVDFIKKQKEKISQDPVIKDFEKNRREALNKCDYLLEKVRKRAGIPKRKMKVYGLRKKFLGLF